MLRQEKMIIQKLYRLKILTNSDEILMKLILNNKLNSKDNKNKNQKLDNKKPK